MRRQKKPTTKKTGKQKWKKEWQAKMAARRPKREPQVCLRCGAPLVCCQKCAEEIKQIPAKANKGPELHLGREFKVVQ